MEVVSFLPFGGGEAMVHSCHRLCEWKLDWTSGRDRFCSAFFLLLGICVLRTKILTFRQNDKELIGVAWARFTLLAKSGPDLSLPEHLLLQHFYDGLDKEFVHHLDLTSRGSFAHLTLSEGRKVLNKILDRTSFICIHELVPTEPEMCHEEPSEIELEPLESQSVDSTPETSPELKPETPKKEDHLSPEFFRSIEYALFEDFGNTSRYFYQKRPSVLSLLWIPLRRIIFGKRSKSS